ncbi:MAG TPA: RNA polymerase sigma factor [Niabella sp.]|jgi:RNA polymerase sigma-70 factor (ECF subfamily)|nr:RNA polymerase sigma factor [Niabella sp.]HRO83635.1 RNA polymerase sigma factor [Niabella sp.]HUN04264.1 RNA polymerase sigma factor [Niabella sp.]
MLDSEIIKNVLEGNIADYRLIIEKFQNQIFRVAIGFVHNKEDAEEIAQDVFVKAFRNLSSFSGKSSFSTWLYRIAVNQSINFLRSKKRKNVWQTIDSIFNLSSKEKKPDEGLELKDTAKMLKDALDNLPVNQRTAFILSKYEELNQKQIAIIMNSSKGAVEQLIFRAKNNLRKQLSDRKNL